MNGRLLTSTTNILVLHKHLVYKTLAIKEYDTRPCDQQLPRLLFESPLLGGRTISLVTNVILSHWNNLSKRLFSASMTPHNTPQPQKSVFVGPYQVMIMDLCQFTNATEKA